MYICTYIFFANFIFLVKVKWGREMFPDIEVNTDEEPILFKAQLFALTGVQPERQKVMCKGGILKDDEWNLQLKDVRKLNSLGILKGFVIWILVNCCFQGATILLLGTKEQVPEKPAEPVKFIEDMNDVEMASVVSIGFRLVLVLF